MKSGDFLKDLSGKPSLLIPGSEQLHEGYGCQWKLVAVLYSTVSQFFKMHSLKLKLISLLAVQKTLNIHFKQALIYHNC